MAVHHDDMNEPLAICNLVIIVLTGYVTYRGFEQITFRDRLIFEPVRILRDKEYYRLMSSGFLHGDWMHFLFNMFSLYAFGSNIEVLLGIRTFLPIYIAGIVGGNLVSLYLHRNHAYRALGASGGVCGVIFASIFLLPGGKIYILFIPVGIPAPAYAVLFLVVSFIGMRSRAGNIGHDAHLGGALIGLLTATLLHPYILRLSPVLYLSVVLITVALFVYAYRYPAHLQVHSPLTRAHWRQIGRDVRGRTQRTRNDAEQETLDRLLDKVSSHGLHSLTPRERKRLEAISKNRNRPSR